MTEYYDDLETRDPEQREAALVSAAADQIAHAKAKTAYFAKLLADVGPGDIKSREDLVGLPVTRKSDLIKLQKQNPPFGGLAAIGTAETAYVFASPGPIYEPASGRKDYWGTARALFAAGFRTGDLVHNAFSYHLTPGGWILDSAARALGCPVFPAGIGNSEQQVQAIGQLRPAAYTGTPDFLRTLLDKASEMGVDASSITKSLVSGGPLFPSLRADYRQRGISMLQAYVTADVGNIAYETEAMEGMVVSEDQLVEIVRPGTGDLVPEGEVGEVVVTTLNPDYPLIRFGTGDLSAFLPGMSPCGRTNRRIKGWMGRADQTTKVRGMFVHPEQVALVMKRHPEVKKMRLIVDAEQGKDFATLQCEVVSGGEDLAAAIADSFQAACKVRGKMEFVALGSLPNDGKVIDDIRKFD
ncbi:MAG: phenylacetate--CoA ligase family protein [Alphaproteobacteria bacterium]|nr:phenylacetate--CoA ligase family protein [Alphaproteobacteria bacterium]